MSENIINSEPTNVQSDSQVTDTKVETKSTDSSPAVTNETKTEVIFLDSISQDLRAEACLKDFKDINGLAKSYINAQKLVGNSIRIPGEDSSLEAREDFYAKLKDLDGVILKPKAEDKEALDSFYNKLGRPENVDGYKFIETDESLSKSFSGFEDELNDFKSIAHEIGLTNEQANKLFSSRVDTLKELQDKSNINKVESEKELKEIWGKDYENRLHAAKNVAKIYGDKYPDAMEALINGPSGNNPAFLSMLAELGSSFKEKGHEGMQSSQFGVTPDQAVAKIAEKRGDRGFMEAYNNKLSPRHDSAVQELKDLYMLANH